MILVAVSETVTAVGRVAANLLGIAMLSGILASLLAVGYRWYVRERVPSGLALLVGLSGVTIVMGTTNVLANAIGDPNQPINVLTTMFNIGAFAAGGIGAYVGAKTGDRVGTDFFVAAGASDIDADVSEIVQTVGRVISVELPEEIDDVVGYDPVAEETRETLGGRTFLFPRRLTKAELRDRLVSRLKTDYGVGHVDVELGEGGAVEYLALGARAAGIGPTLPPATNAVAVQADPANAASAGDLVQVWETDPARRVLTGELRGVAGDVVTVAIDAADTPKLDPAGSYKLVTLPVQDRPDRLFASLLRAADETLSTVTVERGSALDGAALGSLSVTVAAITREDAPPDPHPALDRTLAAGDVLYAIATPDALRKTEAAAKTNVVDQATSSEESQTAPERSTDLTPDSVTDEGTPPGRTVETPSGDADGSTRANGEDGSVAGGSDPPEPQTPEPNGEAPDASERESTEPAEPDAPVADADSGGDAGAAFPDAEDLPGQDFDAELPSLGLDDADEESDDEADVDETESGETKGDESGAAGSSATESAGSDADDAERGETDDAAPPDGTADEDDPLADVLTEDGDTEGSEEDPDPSDPESWSFDESEGER